MTSGRKRAAAGLAGLIALLLLLFALAGREVKDSPVPEGTGTAPSAGRQQTGGADEKRGAGSPGATGPAAASTAPARPDGAQKRVRREEDLVLTVPADRPLESDIYIVKKGDTLWHISKRFTGNPFNYPRVASDNRIANPDLIFPGQRITLRK